MADRSFLILHGWLGSGPDHWQSWLTDRLRGAGEDVSFPELPECDLPCPDRWGSAMRAELQAMTGRERVVICHSLSSVMWFREAGGLPAALRPDRCLLVSPPCPAVGIDEIAAFFPGEVDHDAIRRAAGTTRLVCSDNDPYCPDGVLERWARPLGLTADVLPGAAHINDDAGYGPWPAVEAWALGHRESLAAAP